MDLQNELNDLTQRLTIAVKTLKNNGKALAEAERDYKVILSQEALKLRQQKDMPVTLINQIIYGIKEVADKRFQRDVAQTMYTTNLEYINSTKLQIRLLESQLSREYGNIKG